MRRLFTAALLLGSLSGCTEGMYMRNPTTGQVATCGEHPLLLPIYAMVAMGHDKECVQQFKDQGYVRVPKPG